MVYTSEMKAKVITLTASVFLGIAGAAQPLPDFNSAAGLSFASSLSISECTVDPATKRWVKFQALVEQWQQERGGISSITEMSMLPSYQKIIGIGEDAIPMIIAQLKIEGEDPDQWFWALRAISEANDLNPPEIKPEQQGNFSQMAKVWIDWAETEGHAG